MKARSIYKKIYKVSEVDHLSELYVKIATAAIKSKDDFIYQKYFSIHESVFGVEHPRTVDFYKALS